MMLFWVITAAMILAALALLIPALLRNRHSTATDRNRQNVVIARERLEELKQERAQGVLSEEQYEQSKRELEQSLLVDLGEPAHEEPMVESRGSRWLSLGVMLVLVPALTLGMYSYLGSPGLIERPAAGSGHAGTGSGELPSVEEMLGALVARLEEDPSDADGWFLLGRTYMAMKDFSKAAQSYQRLHELVGDEPVVLLAWADAAAMSQKGDLSGRPAELVRKAVRLAPNDTTALWLGGMVEMQAGNAILAIEYFERLQPLIQDDPKSSERIASLLVQARERAGVTAAADPAATLVADRQPVASGGSVSVRVTLSSDLQGKVSPEERLFIFARALQGPKMPLAAARYQVKDLPLELSLDDSSAMVPAMKISNFDQVVVGARVSRSGDPVARSGDLTGEVSPVVVGDPMQVLVVIDTVVP